MLHLGFKFYVSKENISLIGTIESRPMKRFLKDKKELDKVFDASNGKKALSVVILKDGNVVISSRSAATLFDRFMKGGDDEDE